MSLREILVMTCRGAMFLTVLGVIAVVLAVTMDWLENTAFMRNYGQVLLIVVLFLALSVGCGAVIR